LTGVDSSGPAVELATVNAVLNQVDPNSCTFVKADITPFLKDAIAAGKSWDIVVLDPPKLAPNRKVIFRGMHVKSLS
jgi:23S rRNA G2069 N7-methylase RlmK/C1962 C5-methylase RlmI